MSDRIVLHIGAMKTGTTFLQTTMERNRDLLAESGLDFTGGRFAYQTRAVNAVLKRPDQPGRRLQRWRKLAARAREAPQPTSVVSMEFLSFASERQVRDLLRPLRKQGLRVEVVMTVRDQFLVAPAQWQTYCRNYGLADWPTYLREIEEPPTEKSRSSASHTFHRAQDIDVILGRWSEAEGVDVVHVVTVPGRGAPVEELWNRFFAAAGVAPPAADFDAGAPNTSLGFGSCDLLRRLNRHLGDVPGAPYRTGMRQLAREVLAERRDQESRPALDRAGAQFARTRNTLLRDLVADRGYRLHGDLAELPVPETLDDYPAAAQTVAREEVAAAADAAWDYLAARLGATGRRPRTLRGLVAAEAEMLRRVHGWDRVATPAP